jgi:predicted nucleic acid-binding protein
VGPLTLPSSGLITGDSAILIYTVERHPQYGPLLKPFRDEVRARRLDAAASELTILETLVLPIRTGNAALQSDYETTLFQSDLWLHPVTEAILRDSARLRAEHGLRTPDAIHAATALAVQTVLFITNDGVFRRVPGLSVAILNDFLPGTPSSP